MATFAYRKKADDAFIEPRRLCWFVHPATVPPMPLGFIRDNRGGALVIGGKTGSHYTGHAESWWHKLSEIAALGYIPVEVAREQEVITHDWSAPEIDDKDAYLVKRIQKGEI